MPLRKVPHRFLHHKINPNTEILIVGTFNPEAEDNAADFFYGRIKNHMWTLMPVALGDTSLKGKNKEDKLEFIKAKNVDFIDVISEVEVEEGSEANYADDFIDSRITAETKIVEELCNLKNLKKVGFTRKTFAKVPNIQRLMRDVEKYCIENNIDFEYLETPARFYSDKKQAQWTNFLS